MKKLIALVFLASFLSVQIAPVMAGNSSISIIENGDGEDAKAKKKDRKKAERKSCDKKEMKEGCCKDMEKAKKDKKK